MSGHPGQYTPTSNQQNARTFGMPTPDFATEPYSTGSDHPSAGLAHRQTSMGFQQPASSSPTGPGWSPQTSSNDYGSNVPSRFNEQGPGYPPLTSSGYPSSGQSQPYSGSNSNSSQQSQSQSGYNSSSGATNMSDGDAYGRSNSTGSGSGGGFADGLLTKASALPLAGPLISKYAMKKKH